jgi:hypothetical protein
MSFFDRITETEDKPDYFDRNSCMTVKTRR